MLELSNLNKTWIFDLDGTLVKHNGYLLDGADCLLDGVKSFLDQIPKDDYIVILSARSSMYKTQTEEFLQKEGIRYNIILFDIPLGERILVNDKKPSGLKTAYSFNIERDEGINIDYSINEEL